MPKNQAEKFEELFGPEPAAEPAPKAEADATEEAPSEPKPQEPAMPEPPATEQPPEPPKAQEPARIDPEQFKGYLEEREKRQEWERKARDYETQLAQLKQQSAPKEPPPDIYNDPDSYARHLQSSVEQQVLASKVQQSRFLAAREFGEETVSTVQQWAEQLPPALANQLIAHPSPFHAAVEMYRKEQAATQLAQYGYDLDKFVAAKMAQAAPASPPLTQQPQQAVKLPPKIAGAGGAVRTNEMPVQSEADFFRSVFKR